MKLEVGDTIYYARDKEKTTPMVCARIEDVLWWSHDDIATDNIPWSVSATLARIELGEWGLVKGKRSVVQEDLEELLK